MNDATFVDRRIMASAGTGKTWNLVARYLDLVLAGVDPATILATTFTRAAAAEIRDRVLTDAAALVLEPEARSAAASAGRFASGPVDEIAAHRLLHDLVARLPGLQIRTLDSLFVSLAKGLGAASGVPAGARMVDEAEAAGVLRSAIGDALDEADEAELLSTLETLGRGATRVAVVPTVERAIAGLLAVAEESTKDAWRWPMPARDADALERIAEILAVPDPSMGKGMLKAFQSLERLVAIARTSDGGIWQAIQESRLVFAGGPDGSGVWSRQTIPESMMPALARLHTLALDGNRRNLARRTACLRDLVDRVAPHLRRRKRSARVAVFDDFVRALDPQRADASPEGLAELWFRLDTSLEHLLLDEFQDTSATQLRAIRPVATEILSGGDGERPRSLLVVGDVKQSIYGWRGGDPAILERLDEIVADGPVALDDRTLVTSYRSSRAVIDLVNAVFEGIADNPAVHARSSEAATHFARLFRSHDTVKRHAGRAAVEFLPHASDAAERLQVVAESAADAAAELVRRHGLAQPDGEPSVAVLVRSNKPIGPIVEALRARDIPASGRGGGSLLDAEAAVVVVQAFRLAADPEDRLAAEDLARSPLGPLVGLEASEGHARVSDPDRRTTARRLRTLFGDQGPATVVDRWRRTLMDRLTAREAARLRQMVELLESVDRDPEADRSPQAIARQLETCRVEDPGGDGVVVMTIHQAKGLEFPGVVVTEMHQALFRQPTVAVATPAVPATPSPEVATWYSESVRPEEAVEVHQASTDRAVLESLCGLYVALTRAADDLVVQVERPHFTKKDRTPGVESLASLGGVVRAAIDRDGEEHEFASESDEETIGDRPVIWEATCEGPARTGSEPADSSGQSSGQSPEHPASLDGATACPDWRLGPSTARRRATVAPSPSVDHDRRSMLRPSVRGALDRGRVVHAGLELLAWSNELEAHTDEAFALAVRRACPVAGVVDPAAIDGWYLEQVATIRRLLADPSVRAVFDGDGAGSDGSEGETPSERRVRREFPVVRRTGQGVQVGLIDRLVLHLDPIDAGSGNSSRVAAASIIDFKTDTPGDGSSADLAAFLGRHRPQLESYREAIEARYGLERSRIRGSLIRVDDGAVVDLEPA